MPSGSESIHKTFRRDNKSNVVWLSLTRLNLQCSYRAKTAKSSHYVYSCQKVKEGIDIQYQEESQRHLPAETRRGILTNAAQGFTK